MASFFSKFMRGATATGGALFADIAREELRAGIMTERDKVLNDNRIGLEKSRQDASTLQHKERLAQQESQFTRRLDEPGHKADKIKLGSAEKLQALKAEYAAAKTGEERTRIANLMAGEQGKPVETSGARGTGPTAATKEARILATLDEFENEAAALKFLKTKEGNMVSTLFKALIAKQEDAYLDPEDPEYLSIEDMLKQAREMAKPDKPVTSGGGKEVEHFNTTKHPSVRTKADFEALDSGVEYFDVFDGKTYWTP